MIKRTVLSLFFLLFALCSYSQSFSGFKVDYIGRQVKEFQLDSINLSSPLNYFLSRAQVRLSGKFSDWGPISTSHSQIVRYSYGKS